jgi:hypothetical protein
MDPPSREAMEGKLRIDANEISCKGAKGNPEWIRIGTTNGREQEETDEPRMNADLRG